MGAADRGVERPERPGPVRPAGRLGAARRRCGGEQPAREHRQGLHRLRPGDGPVGQHPGLAPARGPHGGHRRRPGRRAGPARPVEGGADGQRLATWRPGKKLTIEQKSVNQAHSRLRWPVERAIARIKTWRILRKARCSPNKLTSVTEAILTLETHR
ncbi:transposase family protein [Streptomyces sp. NPDC051366]|uniref:transposase family protein n=1 Tax=Streptomyces sp. NPDC051366 TaxID=3365652 RepID=UPI0037B4B26E